MSSTAGNWTAREDPVPMNFMNFRSLRVSFDPVVAENFWVCAGIVCSSIRPSLGRML